MPRGIQKLHGRRSLSTSMGDRRIYFSTSEVGDIYRIPRRTLVDWQSHAYIPSPRRWTEQHLVTLERFLLSRPPGERVRESTLCR